jgi:hypothetical protein
VKHLTAHFSLILVLLLALPACPGPDSKQKALQTSLTALNAARDGFVAWDKSHQQKIVDGATSLEQGKAALAAYRAKREPVEQGFVVAYSALAVAALEKSAAMILEAALAAKEVYTLIKLLTGHNPESSSTEGSAGLTTAPADGAGSLQGEAPQPGDASP